MHSMTRRDVLHLSCGYAALTCAPATGHAASRYFAGCLLTSAGYQQYQTQGESLSSVSVGMFARNRHWHTTGDPSLDADFDRALVVIADLFSVNPAFGFYDPARLQNPIEEERNGMNAFARPENTDIPGTRGTVGFGWDMFLQEFYQHDNTGLTLMTVIAHEFAHVLQHDRGYLNAIKIGQPLKSEINADFLSGYFLGTRKLRIPSLQFQKAGDLLMRKAGGDHGTPQQRLKAAEAGFRVAYVEKKSVDDAVQAGLRYIGF
jgi:hypothetical protein